VNLVRTYNIAACCLVSLAITSYCAATIYVGDPAMLLGFVILPAIIAAWVFSARGVLLLPRFLVNTLLLLAMAYAALRATRVVSVEVVAELVTFIQLIKIGDRRAPRDDAQILSLAVFLAIAAMLTSVQVLVGIQLILFVPLLIVTVMLFQLYSGWFAARMPLGGQAPVAPGTVRGPLPGDAAPAAPAGQTRQLLATAMLATITTMLLAFGVFVVMPRGIGENVLGNWKRRQTSSVTGFTDRVTLGSRNVISTSPKVVLDLIVRESAGPGAEPGPNIGNPDTVYYLRGAILDRYENRTWTTETAVRGATQVYQYPQPDQPIFLGDPTSAPLEQTILLLGVSADATPLFASWRPVWLRAGKDTTNIRVDKSNYTMRRVGVPGPYQYTVWSAIVDSAVEASTRTPTSFPASTRMRDLARQIVSDAGIDPDPAVRPISDDSRASRAIQDYLQRTCEYSLDEQATPPGADPIDNFLFETRSGHCEYFAAAMTALCRTVGINARIVAGYVAAEYDGGTGRYTVRESNAHAWVEAEAGTGRWRRYDPTPPAELARLHKPRTGLFGRFRRALESVEYAWNTSVVGFDEGARQRILGPGPEGRPGVLAMFDAIARRLQAVGPRTFLSALVTGLAVFCLVAAIGIIARIAFVQLGRLPSLQKWLARRASSGAPSRAIRLRIYSRLLDALRSRGHPKPAWQPPLDHIGSLALREPALAEEARTIVDAYYRSAFGGQTLSEDDLARAENSLSRLSSLPVGAPRA
jgi:transglutaminase-like putative cysteine protease